MDDKKSAENDHTERIMLPLPPEQALRALLAVDPDDEPADGDTEA